MNTIPSTMPAQNLGQNVRYMASIDIHDSDPPICRVNCLSFVKEQQRAQNNSRYHNSEAKQVNHRFIQFHPCAFRTAIIVERMSRHVWGFSIVSFENIQPSQLTCCVLRVTSPFSSRSHRPAARTMSILPLGSFGRQWRPVLSCEPEPLTVASFCATWKSFTHGRSAAVIFPRASYNNSLSDQS